MDVNRQNMNAMQQQWHLLRKQEQKLSEATSYPRQTYRETSSTMRLRSISALEVGSQLNSHHQQQQQCESFQEKRQKLLQETNFPQQYRDETSFSDYPLRSVIVPGMCAQRLTQFLYHQKQRPRDNNIDFWRKFVSEFFTADGKNRCCLSFYGDCNQTRGVFTQNKWQCKVCYHRPTRGFETTGEALPRLYKTKYDSGVMEELLYVDMPHERLNSSGQMVLHYEKVREHSVFERVHVVREGQLQIVFTPDLKICSWEFCVHRHEETIPKSFIAPQVTQLGEVVQTYQNAAKNAMLNSSVPELPHSCDGFVQSATQLQKSFEVPMLNDLGYTTKYVRCLQMSEVIYGMKQLVDYNRETGIGPLETYSKFSNKNLPGLRKNIDNNEHLENDGVHIPEADTSIGSDNFNGNSLATTCVITDNGPQQNSSGSENGSGPDDGSPAQDPCSGMQLGSNDMSSEGSNISPENGTDDNKLTNEVVNEKPAVEIASDLTEAVRNRESDHSGGRAETLVMPKDDDLDNLLEDFDDKFLNDHELKDAFGDFDWSC